MPKVKTKRGLAKRVKATGTGKVRRYRAGKSHLLTKKSRARKRRLRQGDLIHSSDVKRIRRLVPYL
jgi:large subunit ribosomal protein L35